MLQGWEASRRKHRFGMVAEVRMSGTDMGTFAKKRPTPLISLSRYGCCSAIKSGDRTLPLTWKALKLLRLLLLIIMGLAAVSGAYWFVAHPHSLQTAFVRTTSGLSYAEIERRAAKGDATSLRYLSLMHAQGEGGYPRNDAMAMKLMRAAAAKQDFEAVFYLSGWLMDGRHGEHDEVEGFRLLSELATQITDTKWRHSANARLYLLFLSGEGKIAADGHRALDHAKVLADEGNTLMQSKVAQHLLSGDIVPVDRQQGLMYLKRAADAGNEEAREAFRSLN